MGRVPHPADVGYKCAEELSNFASVLFSQSHFLLAVKLTLIDINFTNRLPNLRLEKWSDC